MPIPSATQPSNPPAPRTRRTRRAFTAVDLLALVAVGTAVAAVAQPGFDTLRKTGYTKTNAAQHADLAKRQHAFIMSNDGQFTGPNVTGWPDFPAPPRNPDNFLGQTGAATPVEEHDWITPLVGEDLGFAGNRAQRTAQLLTQVRDPRVRRNYTALFGTAPDQADFEAQFAGKGFRFNSYLAPATFQAWGTPSEGFIPGKGFISDTDTWLQKFGGVPYNWSPGLNIATPRGYRPRIERVGTSLANKVMFADGTRYAESAKVIDYTLNPVSGVLGNFSSGFFPSEVETSYGRAFVSSPLNILLSVRGPSADGSLDNRTMEITFFDGSTRTVTLTEAKARAEWWAPTGSAWTSLDAIAPEAAARYSVGDLLP